MNIILIVSFSFFFSTLAYAECNFTSNNAPLYSEQITSEKINFNWSIWPLGKSRLLENDVDQSNKPISIYKSLLNSYQKTTLEEMLFYKTEVIIDIKKPNGHQRIIKAVFPQSSNFDLFLIEISKISGDYYMKTIISTNIELVNLSKVINKLTNVSIQIKNICGLKNV